MTYFLNLAKQQFQSMSIVLNALDYYRCNFRNVWLRRPLAVQSHAFLLSGKQIQGGSNVEKTSFPVPTLSIGGALDGCIMTDVFQASHNSVTQDFAHLEMLVVENAGHFVHLEQPGIVNRRIAAFIKKFN